MLQLTAGTQNEEIEDELLHKRIEQNLLTLMYSGLDVESIAIEFGAERFLVKTVLGGKSLSLKGLIRTIVMKKIKFSKHRKDAKKLPPKIKKILISATVESVLLNVPSVWLTNQQSANFVGVSRPQLDKLLVKYSEEFFALFPEENDVKNGRITHGKIPQSNIALYNPLLIGLINWYHKQTLDSVEPGSQSINCLARELNVDFYTIANLAVVFLEENEKLGKWAKLPGKKSAFYCSPNLINMIQNDLAPDQRPAIVVDGFRWETFAAVTKLINNPAVSESKVRFFASKFRGERPEWFVPFEVMSRKSKAEYCNPRLVKLIVEHFSK